MALARAAVALGVAVLVALAIYLFVVKPSGHEYTLIFENAGQLVDITDKLPSLQGQ